MKTDPRPDWTVTIEVPVVWAEMDAFGHVNNAVYLRYFESSRIEYLRQAGWFELPTAPGGRVGVILHSVQARFRRPVTFPDTLLVSSRLLTIAEDRFTLEHQVWSTKMGEVGTEGQGLIVSYDYQRHEKALIPEAARQRILALESGAGRPPPSDTKADSPQSRGVR
jgi:acyl-CoA thioester hydrolase